MSSLAEELEGGVLGEISAVERERICSLYLASAFPVTGRSPRLFAAAGNVGAGKTSLLRFLSANGQLPGAHAVRHDPDSVMSELKGFREDTLKSPVLAFKRWELPARELADEIVSIGIQRRCDIVYDRTCAFPETLALMRQLRFQKGYFVSMFFVWAPLEQCLQRAERRAQNSRRFVPPAIIQQRADSLRELLHSYLDVVNELHVYQNNDGQDPQLVGTLRNGRVREVPSEEAFAQFLSEYNVAL